MAFLDELGARLVAQGVGTLGTNIFYGASVAIPVGDGPYLTLSETGGMAPTRIQNMTVPRTRRPTAQVFVRAKTYAAARAMAVNAYNALDGVFNLTLSGVAYLSITARQEPTDVGMLDAAARVQIVFNVAAEKVT